MYRNQSQNKRLHQLIGELNIDNEQKEELVYQYTNGREKSSAKMLMNECQSLINYLDLIKKGNTPKQQESKEITPAQRMRRKILSICHEMGWKQNGAIDWDRLNGWLSKSGYLKKDLNDYTEAELPKLVTQFEQLLKSHYAKR